VGREVIQAERVEEAKRARPHGRISLGKRLRSCPSFRCVGVLPEWKDYPDDVREAIRRADEVFYASPIYEDLFRSLGKKIFPRNYYRFMGNKIRQTELFQFLEISHPRTRFYTKRNRFERICRDFTYPFVAKIPVGSSKGAGVYLIRNDEDLTQYLEEDLDTRYPAYIQEYLPIDRDIRVVLLGGKVVHAYWRIPSEGEFRNNVARGADISYDNVPEEVLRFAEDIARRCRFDEVGVDICWAHGRYYILEANMVFGLEGFRQAGLDIYELLAQLDREGVL